MKQNIHDSKDRAEGVVKGSQGRFGFVALDDGRDIYLSPEQMQRVFPDDRIAIEVIAGAESKSTKEDKRAAQSKPAAQLERLIHSSLRAFTGQYVVRDNAHFVEIDLPKLSRWIFVPPKLRRAAKGGAQSKPSAVPQHGDWVRAHITQHPFADGKPQAAIDAIIGSPSDKNIAARYALARFDLHDAAPPLIESDLEQAHWETRRDLTSLPFVTIDGAETRDMDDALYAEPTALDATAQGWRVYVAIADPSAWIKIDSTLEKTIAARATSVYLPDFTVPMLPEALANDKCSLQPNAERLALVCEMLVASTGAIASYTFSEARIRSQAKLTYDEVSAILAAPTHAENTPWLASLCALQAASESLQQYRRAQHIVLPERGEYRSRLDDNGKIVAYTRQQKTTAHLLVEECMVAVNRCAADYLRGDRAIFVSHRGFRSERCDNVNKLLAAELPQFTGRSVEHLADYVHLMQTLASTQFALPLREILFRSLERSQFSAEAAAHFGMGLECYTTITSPIRKFNDYWLHRLIKAKLRDTQAHASSTAAMTQLTPQLIPQLQDGSDRARQASNYAQQWLDCEFLSQAEYADRVWRAELIHVTSSGFVVRLLDNGIQGFVDTRHSGEKFSFDAVYMRLGSAQHTYQLEQQVDVKVSAIDMKKRTISFQLVSENSGSDPLGLTPGLQGHVNITM